MFNSLPFVARFRGHMKGNPPLPNYGVYLHFYRRESLTVFCPRRLASNWGHTHGLRGCIDEDDGVDRTVILGAKSVKDKR